MPAAAQVARPKFTIERLKCFSAPASKKIREETIFNELRKKLTDAGAITSPCRFLHLNMLARTIVNMRILQLHYESADSKLAADISSKLLQHQKQITNLLNMLGIRQNRNTQSSDDKVSPVTIQAKNVSVKPKSDTDKFLDNLGDLSTDD